MRAKALVAAAALLAVWPAGSSLAYDNPKALLQAIYEPMTQGQLPKDLNPFYSDGLRHIFAEHTASQASLLPASTGEPARKQGSTTASFDPFLSGANVLLFGLAISEPVVMGDRAMATVSYDNFDHPALLSISMVKQADGWKVDDVASLGPDQHWLLSWLLLHDPWSGAD